MAAHLERQEVTFLDGTSSTALLTANKVVTCWEIALERLAQVDLKAVALTGGATALLASIAFVCYANRRGAGAVTLTGNTQDQQTRLSTDFADLQQDLTTGRHGSILPWAGDLATVARPAPSPLFAYGQLVLTRDATAVTLGVRLTAVIWRHLPSSQIASDDFTSLAVVA